MLLFEEKGKPEYPEKTLSKQERDQPTYDAASANRTRATLVGGECCHHYAIPVPCSYLIVALTTFRNFMRRTSLFLSLWSMFTLVLPSFSLEGP